MSAGRDAAKKAIDLLGGKKVKLPEETSKGLVSTRGEVFKTKVTVRAKEVEAGQIIFDERGVEPIGVALEGGLMGDMIVVQLNYAPGGMIYPDGQVPDTPVIEHKKRVREEHIIGSFQGMKAKLDGKIYNPTALQTVSEDRGGWDDGPYFGIRDPRPNPGVKSTSISMTFAVNNEEVMGNLQWLVGQPKFDAEFVLVDDRTEKVSYLKGKAIMEKLTPSYALDGGGMMIEAQLRMIGDLQVDHWDKRTFVAEHGKEWWI